MGAGIIFSQLLDASKHTEGQAFALLGPGKGRLERLSSQDPAGQWATLDTLPDVDASPLPPLAPGLVRYRCPMVTDTGAVEQPYGILMLVAFAVPAERKAEVDDWYLNEHIELLMRAPGWLRARRYEVEEQGGEGRAWTHLAFHELRDISVMASEERKIARSTEWRARLETEEWFQTAGRWIFQPAG